MEITAYNLSYKGDMRQADRVNAWVLAACASAQVVADTAGKRGAR